MSQLNKNKVQKTKRIKDFKEDDKENFLLNRIIKTRKEIVDLLKVLKTF